jgi:SAM-dependent methyltransferase
MLAECHPELECTVLDLPPVVDVASDLIEQSPAAERVHTLPGDYHRTEFPAGQDAVIFFGVLHQEPAEEIARLMARAHDALKPGGQVYVMDMMTRADHSAPKFSALFAVNMALTTEHGWVFSDEELRGWVEDAGFNGFSVQPLPAPMPHWLARAVA